MNDSILSNLVELCALKGVRHAVLCPGSRSAPLTRTFVHNKKIKCWTFSDERSAAFIALGMARQTQSPVVLVCTSGSAAYNFAPAVAEAFFQRIPLIVFTADRPGEWIDQLDGQTIRQTALYGNHVKKYAELPLDYSHGDLEWYANRILNEVINAALAGPQGPVHVNSPFREPLYAATTSSKAIKNIRVIEPQQEDSTLSSESWGKLLQRLKKFKKILIVAGQNDPNPRLSKVLIELNATYPWPVAGDVLSNLHGLPFYCRHTDTFLGQLPENKKKALRPDLIITFGKSLISKNLKLFLRTYRPQEHWHIQPGSNPVADTFQSLTKIVPVDPVYFFSQLNKSGLPVTQSWAVFQSQWSQLEEKAVDFINQFFSTRPKGEFSLVKQVIGVLPDSSFLHLANSMSVRYANHIGLASIQKLITVCSNRGTSGIDGCTSTAVGHALTSTQPHVLITGDVAFFYDRNAFWHNYALPNLYIILLNNHGGIIFNMIDGPSRLPEAEEFFITRQQLDGRSLADEFGFTYFRGPEAPWRTFFRPGRKTKIMELDSSQSMNKKIFKEFKKEIKKYYET